MPGLRYKTPEEIEKMRAGGRLVRRVLERLREMVAPGVSTAELNAEAERITAEAGADCLFKGVPSPHGAGPFPAAICASPNDAIVHGIPSEQAVLKEGDILSVDFGIRLNGWCGDAAETYAVGEISTEAKKLLDVTRNARTIATDMARPGMMWSDIATTMQQYVEDAGFSVVRELVGHGIGQEMWEPPSVPNFWQARMRRQDFELKEGLVIAVEPMVNVGKESIRMDKDGWTILTRDGSLSAHFENTLAITADGVDVLTGSAE
ncbi:MAG: type I methionyl aminopeptidase [Phycisphaerae bacterium]